MECGFRRLQTSLQIEHAKCRDGAVLEPIDACMGKGRMNLWGTEIIDR